MREWTKPVSQNTPATRKYLEKEEIVDAPEYYENATVPEKEKRPNPLIKMMVVMIIVCPLGIFNSRAYLNIF